MPAKKFDKRPHLVLRDTSKSHAFTAHPPNGGAKCVVPDLPRQQHGQALNRQLNDLNDVMATVVANQREQGLESGFGLQIQFIWMDNLRQRTRFTHQGDGTPRICLLDSGINRGHDLLEPLLTAEDMHSVEPTGITDDTANHGTGMAGLAAYGDLTEVIAANSQVEIKHRLESVRLISAGGANAGSALHHAALFSDAVARHEIAFPNRKRIFCSAVSASDYRDRGRPSSWSAAVDSLASDADGAGQFPRLFVLSAGNTNDVEAGSQYSVDTNRADRN